MRSNRAIAVFFRPLMGAAICFALAGCVDYTVDVAITSDTTGAVSQTEFYEPGGLERMSDFQNQGMTRHEYCGDAQPGKTLTKHPDGSASCVRSAEGGFDTLTALLTGNMFDEHAAAHPYFALEAPGQVRVTLNPRYLLECIFDPDMPAEVDAELKAGLDGHAFKLRFSGAAIVESNMTMSDDGRSVEASWPMYDVMRCKVDAEMYAVIRTR